MNHQLIKGQFFIQLLKGLDFQPSSEMKRIKGVTWDNNENHAWYVASLDGRQVACCGMFMKGGVVRYKTDVVLPEFRGQGLYRILFDLRQAYAINCGAHTATTFSNRESRHMYLKQGFEPAGEESEAGVLYMKKTYPPRPKAW